MNKIKKEHILSAIAEIGRDGIRSGRHSSTYDLVYEGKRYPPKLVISIANRFATGEELDSSTFAGGSGTPAFKILENEGFIIVQKQDPIKKLIERYKEHIASTHLEDEIYKWKLVSEFSGRPNTNAVDFSEEIKSIKYKNLVYKMANAVINQIAIQNPEELRIVFDMLFNETTDLTTRINTFNSEILKIYRALGETMPHHQDERTIASYLTLYKPDKYTFYKSSFYKELCELLKVKAAKKNEKYPHYLLLLNKIIKEYIREDSELIGLVKSYIPNYYDGSSNLLLAQDIMYQMFDKKQYWLYSPGENASMWEDFYQEGIMRLGWDDIGDLEQFNNKNEIKDALLNIYGGEGDKRNDVAANEDFIKQIRLGDVIIVKKGRGELLGYGIVSSGYYFDKERDNYKHCRKVDWKLKGSWKVDFSLVLKTLTNITKYPSKDPNYSKYYELLLAIMEGNQEVIKTKTQMEDLNFKVPLNQILYGPPGTGKTYYTKELAVKIGNPDFIFESTWAEEEKRKNVSTEYDKLYLEGQIIFTTFHQSMSYEDFIEGIKPLTKGENVVYHIENGIFKKLCKSASEPNFEVGQTFGKYEIVKIGNELIYILKPEARTIVPIPKYLVNELFELVLNKIITIDNIKNKTATDKMQITTEKYIVNGYPNVFASLVEEKIKHQKNKKNYVIIIDEINRGNVSGIFGELITLLEEDKRIGKNEELTIKLPYSKTEFGVPSNLYIVGTMNTADRSVEALDTALRRRFSFTEIMPVPELLEAILFNGFNLSQVLQTINQRIEGLLDRDHTIGHSYFMKVNSNNTAELKSVFQNCIIPLLQEYFYNDYEKIALILGQGFVTVKENKNIKFASFKGLDQPEITKQFELIKDIDNIEEAVMSLLNKNE